jgi:hypothetical protein
MKVRLHLSAYPTLLKYGYEGNFEELLRISKYTKGYFMEEKEKSSSLPNGESEKVYCI